MVKPQPRPNVEAEKSLAKTDVQLSENEISGTSDSEGTEPPEAKLIEETGASHEDTGSSGEVLEDWDPVIMLDEDSDSDDEDSDSDDETFYDAISFDGDDEDVYPQEVVKTESQTGTCSDRLLLPVRRLEKEYERCMQMSAEELSLESAVYIHEGSELLTQLRDELAMLPELRELSPECDIDKADVGEPGRTTQAEEDKLRTRLRAFRIALGYPDVIVLKKNGVDIRMCIDYHLVNGFIQLSNYPLPLIDDLLIGFESAMWFMSLDMVSGFWAVRMTERAKLISAFVCPFGHFQWVRMPFGLKNAPLVYQAVINNCLLGFVRLSPEEEAEVDQGVLEFLGLDPSKREESGSQVSAWDQLCDDLDALQFRLRYWNISVSLPKSEFGKLSIPYLSHVISAEGIRAVPKIAKGVQDLPFPKTLQGVQSFLGSLNYYHKFIEDFPVVAAVLYELSDDQVRSERDLTRPKAAFEILKKKIVSAPLLRYPDRSKPFVIIPHANRWAACAVLGQEYDGKIQPVRFTGRVLNDAELRYHIAEKAVIAVLKVLQVSGHFLKVQRDEDGLAVIMGAGITPREHLDEVAESLIPAKGCVRKPPVLSVEMLDDTYQGIVLMGPPRRRPDEEAADVFYGNSLAGRY
ncbi:unnamed protein product [Phytophthora fragariaefolia]|uniref:Unnamed protein product n=1 Tax=Phytophthora fragariaefolia TaxID=1490495 RepID=A0A9W7CPY1_9STRA|nr:unnamed protein product [Phytophthora fragariaefolia]